MHYEIYKDLQQQWRWRIIDSRSRVAATSSDAYEKREDALRSLMQIRQHAASAQIYDHSLNKWLGTMETSNEE
ncbi:YegP family protein [Noviherbaspirillum massiliense]|uniref:YegP family protein n=1 Tax=Noviherbaspirillum massiliense TaxID=1465823 RepID=UPI0002DF2F6F|nr:DUF1508 domain-containing protein [Noviherbaspirillum massiliense]